MKIVTVSDNGIVSQMPDTPTIFGRIKRKTTTNIKDLNEEITAEIKPFPRAVK